MERPGDSERWHPPDEAMDTAHDSLNLGSASPEALNDDGVAKHQYDTAAQRSMRDAEAGEGAYRPYDPPNTNRN